MARRVIMNIDVRNHIIELEDSDFRFDVPMFIDIPEGQTFLGTVLNVIPVYDVSDYETYKKIRFTYYSWSVYHNGKYLTVWFSHHNCDSTCLLDWEVEQVEGGFVMTRDFDQWQKGDFIPADNIRVLDSSFGEEKCILYIAKRPRMSTTQYFANGNHIATSTTIDAIYEVENCTFNESKNFYSGYFTLHTSNNSWSIECRGVYPTKEVFIKENVQEIIKYQTHVEKIYFRNEVVYNKVT